MTDAIGPEPVSPHYESYAVSRRFPIGKFILIINIMNYFIFYLSIID